MRSLQDAHTCDVCRAPFCVPPGAYVVYMARAEERARDIWRNPAQGWALSLRLAGSMFSCLMASRRSMQNAPDDRQMQKHAMCGAVALTTLLVSGAMAGTALLAKATLLPLTSLALSALCGKTVWGSALLSWLDKHMEAVFSAWLTPSAFLAGVYDAWGESWALLLLWPVPAAWRRYVRLARGVQATFVQAVVAVSEQREAAKLTAMLARLPRMAERVAAALRAPPGKLASLRTAFAAMLAAARAAASSAAGGALP